MSMYSTYLQSIESNPRTWLVTGAAGFIGSNIVEKLLQHGQKVRGLDNFSTGYQKNLDMIQDSVEKKQWHNFQMIEGDIRDLEICRVACKGVNHILHQAALSSVPRSIEDPLLTNSSNIDGFLNMLISARDENATFVYAASSAIYGDDSSLPSQEKKIGTPLSPYAMTKYVNELYASIFAKSYNFKSIGLRYFNIFGKRQDPNGAYASVIPQWFSAMLSGKKVFINGDGETSRDFCYIDDCIQANILASCSQLEAWDNVYNVGFGKRTSLNELFYLIRNEVSTTNSNCKNQEPIYQDFRQGDARHTLADISKAKKMIGYSPKVDVRKGLELAGKWYSENLN